MRVLITGASGFVGRAVTEAVVRRGHAVRGLVRRPPARGVPGEWFAGSVCSGEDLRRAMAGCDAVIHLVGIIGEVGDQTFDRVHRQGTQRVVEACSAAGVRRLIHMSALGTRSGAISGYHRSKWAAEQVVRESGLDWTVFRPSVIYGPGDGFVNLFVRMSRWSPVLPVIGRADALLQPVPVDAVAGAFAAALDSEVSVRKTYDLCGPEPMTLGTILRILLEVAHRRRWIVRIPTSLARIQAILLERIHPLLLRRAAPLTRDQILMLQEDNVGDPLPAERDLSVRTVPFREGLRRFLG
jgi:NADH dehydrogenase